MKIAHVLRKYNPKEWAGTETAIMRLLEGFSGTSIESIIFCPSLEQEIEKDPLADIGTKIVRFSSFLTVLGGANEKERLISIGGNLMSFQLIWLLLNEPNLSLIHAHTQGALGGVCRLIARMRNIPFVLSIHGGVLDLPQKSLEALIEPLKRCFSFGKLFNWPLRTQHLLEDADAILTVNEREAQLIKAKYPFQRVILTSHSVSMDVYKNDHRLEARKAFPNIVGKQLLFTPARIDPVKNQLWVIDRMVEILKKYPDVVYVMAGAITDSAYYDLLKSRVEKLGIQKNVCLIGCLPPDDARLIGLFQEAKLLLLPSVAEPFGLVILESWAAGTPVISSNTSGAITLLKNKENGWVFDLSKADSFYEALDYGMRNDRMREKVITEGRKRVEKDFEIGSNAAKMEMLYSELIQSKKRLE